MIDVRFESFFDRPKVLAKIKDGTKSALSKMGAFIRTRARTSIRKRKKVAQPGTPPSSHRGQLRDLLFFAFDTKSETVVVGPQLFKQQTPTAPNLLEHGGKSKDSKGMTLLYRKFPFMKPAQDAELPNFPECFAGSVRE